MKNQGALATSLSDKIKRGIRRARQAGKPIGAHGHRLAALHRAEATARALVLLHIVDEFRLTGATYRDMVRTLNARSEPTPSGTGSWHVKTLQRLVERARDADPLLLRSALAVGQSRRLCSAHREMRDRAALLAERLRTIHAELKERRERLFGPVGLDRRNTRAD
jgi:hypothetical protein